MTFFSHRKNLRMWICYSRSRFVNLLQYFVFRLLFWPFCISHLCLILGEWLSFETLNCLNFVAREPDIADQIWDIFFIDPIGWNSYFEFYNIKFVYLKTFIFCCYCWFALCIYLSTNLTQTRVTRFIKREFIVAKLVKEFLQIKMSVSLCVYKPMRVCNVRSLMIQWFHSVNFW